MIFEYKLNEYFVLGNTSLAWCCVTVFFSLRNFETFQIISRMEFLQRSQHGVQLFNALCFVRLSSSPTLRWLRYFLCFLASTLKTDCSPFRQASSVLEHCASLPKCCCFMSSISFSPLSVAVKSCSNHHRCVRFFCQFLARFYKAPRKTFLKQNCAHSI